MLAALVEIVRNAMRFGSGMSKRRIVIRLVDWFCKTFISLFSSGWRL